MSFTLNFRPRLTLRLLLSLVAAIALVLGGFSIRIKRQQSAVHQLRELGGQLESPELDVATWVSGLHVENVQFLGPGISDQQIPEIATAAVRLEVKRITFLETAVTQIGQQQLQSRLPAAEIRLVTASPSVQPSMPIENRR